jgi:hypothetical protein
MPWQYLPLTYRVLGPVHIGYRSVGIIDRTRYYVLGKNFWAALTESLTPRMHPNPQAGDYQAVGQLVEQHLRFTYFFPAAGPAENPLGALKSYLPRYEKGHTIYVEHPAAQEVDVEAIFVSSYVSTALDYGRHAAAEGLLHETEHLQSQVEIEGNPWTTHLVGGVWVAPASDPSGVEVRVEGDRVWVGNLSILDSLTIGGERGYGFGRLRLTEDRTDHLKLGGWETQEGGPTGLHIEPTKEPVTILAHVEYESDMDYEGLLEPVVGREWDAARGAGRSLAQGAVYLAPGGRCSAPAYAIDGRGFWKIIR